MIYLATPGHNENREDRTIFYNHVIGSNGERGVADYQLIDEVMDWTEATRVCTEKIKICDLVLAFPGKGYNDQVKSAINTGIRFGKPVEIMAFKQDAVGTLFVKREKDEAIKRLGTDINLKQFYAVRACKDQPVKIILPNNITPWTKHLVSKYQKLRGEQKPEF